MGLPTQPHKSVIESWFQWNILMKWQKWINKLKMTTFKLSLLCLFLFMLSTQIKIHLPRNFSIYSYFLNLSWPTINISYPKSARYVHMSVQPFAFFARKTNTNWMNITLYKNIKFAFVKFSSQFFDIFFLRPFLNLNISILN